MTRFARAKGSKASNVKTPEDSTPWEVMKEQLMKSKKENEEANKREEAEKQRVENYNKFLKEQKTQKRQATWCDFPEAVQLKKPKVTPDLDIKSKKQKKKKAKSSLPQYETEINTNTTVINTDNNSEKKNKMKRDLPIELHEYNTSQTVKIKKKKKDKMKSKEIAKSRDLSLNDGINNSNHETIEDTGKNNCKSFENNIPKDKQKKKKKTLKNNLQKECEVDSKNSPIEGQSSKSFQNKKKKFKTVDGKPTRRKTINDHSFELIINGKNVELVRFDGFPIMKKDAERLRDLKNNMIKKGIPKSEVQRTMKLERRRAEKALARLKRDVCYNCRKGGHNLSDCPDLKSNIPGKEGAEGICFKCGSTEHRQFECKVQRDKEFRFATCFICRESGHIARQCPDNPKGLYPNGGGCKLCGDVTHLRKDCPTVMDKKEETSIKLQTMATDNIEDIGQQAVKVQDEKQRKPKKIKF